MTRGHGWSLSITMRGTFTPYSLPTFTGAFDLTPLFSPKWVEPFPSIYKMHWLIAFGAVFCNPPQIRLVMQSGWPCIWHVK